MRAANLTATAIRAVLTNFREMKKARGIKPLALLFSVFQFSADETCGISGKLPILRLASKLSSDGNCTSAFRA